MSIDFEQVYENLGLPESEVLENNEAGHPYMNDIRRSPILLTLGWDGDFPRSSGALWVHKWKEMFFIISSHYDPEGPFKNITEVISQEYFSTVTAKPELNSKKLSVKFLKSIGRKLLSENGDAVTINSKKFILNKDKLVAEKVTKNERGEKQSD